MTESIGNILKTFYYSLQDVSGIAFSIFLALTLYRAGETFGAYFFALMTYLALMGYGVVLRDRIRAEKAQKAKEVDVA